MAKISDCLAVIFRDCALEDKVTPALEWCDSEGASFVHELLEDIDVLADELQLRRLQKQRLGKALAAASASAPKATASSLEPARGATPSPWAPGGTSAEIAKFMHVKNTFLYLDDGACCVDLRRSQTEPYANGGPTVPPPGETSGELSCDPVGDPVADVGGIYRTKTYDDWEPADEWSWVHGRDDPAAIGAPPSDVRPDVVMALGPGSSGPDGACVPGGVPQTAFGMMWLVPVGRFDSLPGEPPPQTPTAEQPTEPPGERPERAAVLQRAFSVTSSTYRIRWTVDARKLKTMDREAFSPIFELSFAGPVEFRLRLKPKSVHDQKGGASFKRSQGKGAVEFRCLSDVAALMNPVVTFRIGVGSGTDPRRQQRTRGPVQHDFRTRPICGLLDGKDEWDFNRAVDKSTMTFVVVLEVFPGGSPSP